MFRRTKTPAKPQVAPQAAAPRQESELDAAVRRMAENDPTLTAVDLRNKNVGDAGATKIAAALHDNNTLTTLNLQLNNIGAKGGKALADALQHNNTLTTLDLGSNSILDGKALANALRHNNTLTTLDLRYNSIGVAGGKALADALRRNNTLTTLDLGGNSIGDEGGKELAVALRHNTTLTELNLEYNSIGDVGGKALADALRDNKTLTTLELRGNNIDDEGGKELADALRDNSTLTKLTLGNNSVGVEGGKALADALRNNNTLTTLDLNWNSIGDEEKRTIERLVYINQDSRPQEAERRKVAEFGPLAPMQREDGHQRGEVGVPGDDRAVRSREDKRVPQATPTELTAERAEQERADRELATELQKKEEREAAVATDQRRNDARHRTEEQKEHATKKQATSTADPSKQESQAADAKAQAGQGTNEPNAAQHNQGSGTYYPHMYTEHLTPEQRTAVSVLANTLADYERSLQSVLGLPESLRRMPPHVQAYFRLCTDAFERLYRAAQVLSTGAVKGQLMDKNMLGSLLDCIGWSAGTSNVPFLGCVSILTTLCVHQLQTKQNNGLWLFQEFFTGDSQSSYLISYRTAVEQICLRADLSKFTDKDVDSAEAKGLRSKIRKVIRSVESWLRKVNLLDIRDLSPIELKVMEDLATVTRGILQLWTEHRDRYDALKEASEDDKATFVLETLGIDRGGGLQPPSGSASGTDHKQRPSSMLSPPAEHPMHAVERKSESSRFRALERELQCVKDELAREKARTEDSKAGAANASEVKKALQSYEELSKKVKRLESKIQTDDNDETVDVGVGGGQAQLFLSKQAKAKANMTPQERRDQETLLNEMAEQNQEIRAQQTQLLESNKKVLLADFMANRLLNLREARELIKRVLMKSSADVAQSVALTAVVQSHDAVALDRNGCFILNGKNYKVGAAPTKWGAKVLWKGDAETCFIKVGQDYNGTKSIRYWFEKNGLGHRYNLHIKVTIMEMFRGEFEVSDVSSHPAVTNCHIEELKSELFEFNLR